MSQPSDHFLGQSSAEHARLQNLALELKERSRAHLRRAGIRRGWRVIDVGCDPQGILHLLAEEVGPTGSVVGLERDARAAALARAFVAEQGLTNVEVVQGDVRTTVLPRDSFDLVHARLVLVNLPEPEQVLSAMVALARPGGVVAAWEADWASWLCYPVHSAWVRVMEALQAVSHENGQDCFIGRRLVGLMRAAELVEVGQEIGVEEWPVGHSQRMLLLQFVENIREKAVGFLLNAWHLMSYWGAIEVKEAQGGH